MIPIFQNYCFLFFIRTFHFLNVKTNLPSTLLLSNTFLLKIQFQRKREPQFFPSPLSHHYFNFRPQSQASIPKFFLRPKLNRPCDGMNHIYVWCFLGFGKFLNGFFRFLEFPNTCCFPLSALRLFSVCKIKKSILPKKIFYGF